LERENIKKCKTFERKILNKSLNHSREETKGNHPKNTINYLNVKHISPEKKKYVKLSMESTVETIDDSPVVEETKKSISQKSFLRAQKDPTKKKNQLIFEGEINNNGDNIFKDDKKYNNYEEKVNKKEEKVQTKKIISNDTKFKDGKICFGVNEKEYILKDLTLKADHIFGFVQITSDSEKIFLKLMTENIKEIIVNPSLK
jgi:hypothetical protein